LIINTEQKVNLWLQPEDKAIALSFSLSQELPKQTLPFKAGYKQGVLDIVKNVNIFYTIKYFNDNYQELCRMKR
jgi:hypothetical protein